VPTVRTFRPGTAIAAAPAPTQPAGRYEAGRGAYIGGFGAVVVVPVVVGVVDVVVVDVVVVVVVVVVVPAANADAAPSAATSEPRRMNQTPRRIASVCRTVPLPARFLQRKAMN
jgi:hypothetical protein